MMRFAKAAMIALAAHAGLAEARQGPPVIPVEDDAARMVLPIRMGPPPTPSLPSTSPPGSREAGKGKEPAVRKKGARPQRADGPLRIVAEPGVNHIVTVATGHLNRVITPFEKPKVRTTAANATIQVSGNVVYVAPGDETPVTMFITDSEDESLAISLTLAPRRIPPREIELLLAAGAGGIAGAAMPMRADKWERADPYVRTITKLLRTIALGRLPPGYSLGPGAPRNPPACVQPGLSFDFRQEVMGHNFNVAIARVTNVSRQTVELVESNCMGDARVAAVAAWPRVMLAPGQRAEVYVVVRNRPEGGSSRPARPSLLDDPLPPVPDEARPGPWGVQVLALSSERVAREQAAALRAMGYPAETYQGKGRLYYVRVSGYATRGEAQAARDDLARFGFDGLVVLDMNRIGPDEEEGR